jgi:hypothetical protein
LTVQFSGVPSSRLGAVWPYVEKLIADALKRGEPCFGPEDVRKYLETGGWQLWIAYRGNDVLLACCTEILNYPNRRVCTLPIVTGQDRDEWIDYLDTIEAWATAQGCSLMKPLARFGWIPSLKRRGYRPVHAEMEKKLCPPQSPPTS